jgi:hypothetical protein
MHAVRPYITNTVESGHYNFITMGELILWPDLLWPDCTGYKVQITPSCYHKTPMNRAFADILEFQLC